MAACSRVHGALMTSGQVLKVIQTSEQLFRPIHVPAVLYAVLLLAAGLKKIKVQKQ